MARIRIRLEDGGLAAVAQAAAGTAMTEPDLRALLAAERVVHGVDEAAVTLYAARLGDPGFAGKAVLARGLAPVPGSDGRVECSVAPDVVPGEVHDDGHIDFRERHFLVPVRDGVEIARVVAPTMGTPGRNVHGAVVAARPGRPHRVRLGPGARLEADRVFATRSGVLLHDERKLDVIALHTHAADVDYASGSLHTEGSLAVRGDVTDGFAATAAGDVHVTGSVLDGTVEAGGTVRVAQGVLGAAASVRAHGNLACRHATAATLHSDGTLELLDQAAHCQLRAQRVRATCGRGAVIGGVVRAAERIDVKVAGTAGGADTLFVLGEDPTGTADREQTRALVGAALLTVADTLHVGVRVAFGEHTWVADRPHHRVRVRWCADTGTVVVEPLR